MPELPEVETIKRDLEKFLKNLRIDDVHVLDKRVLKQIPPLKFKSALKSKKITSVTRRAKALIISFENKLFLVVQLKMTGQLLYGQKLTGRDTKVIFSLSNGKYLNYNDQRTFGWLHVVDSLTKVPYLQTIGPEPFDESFNLKWLKESLKKRTAPIKNLLMNQHFLAGIGNIYASEILYKAKIRPTKKANCLSSKEVGSLHRSSISILEEAIKHRGSSIKNYRDSTGKEGTFNQRVQVYGRDKQDCKACNTPIKRIVQAGRSTFYCTHCQI